MAQPPILNAKSNLYNIPDVRKLIILILIVSDRPALRDLANFVVPQASARWYNLGLQLFDPRDEGVLHSMKTESSKRPEEQCTEVFQHSVNNQEKCYLE